LGCIVILGICPLNRIDVSNSSYAHLLDGETVFQTADGTTRIYMMPYSEQEYMWQLSYPMDEQAANALSTCGGPVALQEEAIRRCRTWHSPIPDILSATPVDFISGYPVYDREILQLHHLQCRSVCSTSSSSDSSHSPRRVTFLGDAIHCMSPFKGQGANQALLDALSFARSLYKMIRTISQDVADECGLSHAPPNHDHPLAATISCYGKELEHAMERYETEMLERSASKVQASAQAAHFLHTEVAVQTGDVTRGAAAAAAAAATAAI
jgi:salicylate hydroxylase